MGNHQENTRRVAKNTLVLYVRMLFSMLVSLYTSRVILNTLGVEDYGIQCAVGGVVGMLSIFTGSLSAAISRYLTFELGRGDKSKLSLVFSSSLVVQCVLAIVIIILLEGLGVWFLNTRMVIPAERMAAANWLLQFSLLSFVVGLISVPYNASIVSHERMTVYAYIGMSEVVVRLLIVLSLKIIPESFDKLIYFAAMQLVSGLAFQSFYWYYCRRHFEECRFRLRLDKGLLKEILGFAGWNFIGASSAVLRDQGGNVILNLFWGPTVNAARGIAQQVSNAVNGFVGNFMTATNPQITKSYAEGDVKYAIHLCSRAARFSFYLLFVLSLPVLFNTEFLIDLWLGQIPEHVILFVRLALIFSLCETISNPLITLMLATGNIRNYQLVVGGLQLLNLPVSYVLLKIGMFPEVVMVVAILLSLSCFAARLVMLRPMVGLSPRNYLKAVVLNILGVIVVALPLPVTCSVMLNSNSIAVFLVSCLLCVLCAGSAVYFIGCSKSERVFICQKAKAVARRVFCNAKD